MRLMSFALTERQLLDGSKTVTRRAGWLWLIEAIARGERPRLIAVRKAMGLRKGEKAHRLAEIEVVDAYPEALSEVTDDEAELEGFPELGGAGFVRFFCKNLRATPEKVVTRIEFKIVEVLDEEARARALAESAALAARGTQVRLEAGREPVELDCWSVVREPYWPPERNSALAGRVDGGKKIRTSPIAAVEGRVITTASGSRYRLGEVDPRYARWLVENGRPADALPTIEVADA